MSALVGMVAGGVLVAAFTLWGFHWMHRDNFRWWYVPVAFAPYMVTIPFAFYMAVTS